MIAALLYLSMRLYASALNASCTPYARMDATRYGQYILV